MSFLRRPFFAPFVRWTNLPPADRRRRRAAATAVIAAITTGTAAALVAGFLATRARIEREAVIDDAAPSDAVVVLGCAVWPGGHPSPALYARTDQGVRVWRATHSRYLLVSGGVGRYAPAEATVMRRIAESKGVPPAAIIDDPYAHRTEASARMCGRIARRLDWRRVTVVSDPWHLARTREQFRDAGVADVRQSPALDSPDWTYPAARGRYIARETAALMLYSVRRLV